ncbi:MAG: hypothetical protein K2H78_01980 [Clostridia bacterium]|nr:hypothetical protein [Clostridia bacterium]
MKKITKAVVGVTLAVSLCAGIAALAGCSADKTGEAYGLVHGGSYVGYTKIVTNGNMVKDLCLYEVCLPTQVDAKDDVADEDKVVNGTKAYYKTVSYGDLTLTYKTVGDVAGYYTSANQVLGDYLKAEKNAKAYYEAVTTNSIKVTVGGQEKTDIMNNATLNKEENGYWVRTDKNGESYSRWKMNRDATVNYVKSYGLANLSKLTKSSANWDSDAKEEKSVTPWMDGNISTGATWNDFNTKPEAGTYYSYAQLIIKASNAAK